MALINKEPYITPDMISAWNSPIIRKGDTVKLTGIYAGVAGANNFAFFVPCNIAKDITSVSLSYSGDNADLKVYLLSDWWGANAMNLQSVGMSVSDRGLTMAITFKTATTTASRPCSVQLTDNVNFTFS